MSKNVNIWVWLQNNNIVKVISNIDEGTIKIYDECNNLILKRTGLSKIQVKQIENNIVKFGAKKLNQHADAFRYL
jgi:hypothetical protein